LGLTIVETADKTAMLVTAVKPDGLVPTWNVNHANQPEQHVKTGDVILQINNVSGSYQEMLEQWNTATQVALFIKHKVEEVTPEPLEEPPTTRNSDEAGNNIQSNMLGGQATNDSEGQHPPNVTSNAPKGMSPDGVTEEPPTNGNSKEAGNDIQSNMFGGQATNDSEGQQPPNVTSKAPQGTPPGFDEGGSISVGLQNTETDDSTGKCCKCGC
jgi:hypothetical protein